MEGPGDPSIARFEVANYGRILGVVKSHGDGADNRPAIDNEIYVGPIRAMRNDERIRHVAQLDGDVDGLAGQERP